MNLTPTRHSGWEIGPGGVQFHPEAFAAVTRGYIVNFADTLRGQGQDPDRLIAVLEETPRAMDLLKGFGDLVFESPA